MVDISKYKEFMTGKIHLKIPCTEDEKEHFGDEFIELNLLITQEQGNDIRSMYRTDEIFKEILKISYPDFGEKEIEIFVMKHGNDLMEAYLTWSGVTQEQKDKMVEMQRTLVTEIIKLPPEEREQVMKELKNAKTD